MKKICRIKCGTLIWCYIKYLITVTHWYNPIGIKQPCLMLDIKMNTYKKSKYLIHIVTSDSSLLLSDGDTPWWVSVTEALLPCPLGGILTPGAHPQVALCSRTVVLFTGHITLMCLRCFLSTGSLAGFPALQTQFIKSFLISWALDPTSCLWCRLLCEQFLRTKADCGGTFYSKLWERK